MNEDARPTRRCSRFAFRIASILLAATLPACGESTVEPTPPPLPPPGVTDFTFLLGSWQGSLAWIDEDGQQLQLEATMTVTPLFQGRVLRQIWRATLAGEEMEVRTHRTRVGTSTQWLAARADGLRRTMTVVEGSFAAGAIVLTSGTRLDPAPMEREVFSEIEGSGFVWALESSANGGTSWAPVMTATYQSTAVGVSGRPIPAVRCVEADYRAFDFWEGDWQVFGSGGGVAGSNLIRSVAGGCALEENWEDGAIPGTSLNMYDPRRERWTQIWMDANGFTLELVGGVTGSTMELAGPRRGSFGPLIDRIRWTPLEDGDVRQLWESQNGPEAPWTVVFNGRYTPR